MRFTSSLIIGCMIFQFFITGCNKNDGSTNNSETDNPTDNNAETVTDFEGNVYSTVSIGNQVWMAENLRTRHAADGTLLSGVYVYNDDEGLGAEYGRLYTWDAALNAAPEGWRVPSSEDWDILESTLGSEPATELRVGGSSGFEAKLGGYRNTVGGYELLERWGMFWTSTFYTNDHAYTRTILHDQTNIAPAGCEITSAISVRCIKN